MSKQQTGKPIYKPAIIGFGLIVATVLIAMLTPVGSRIGWWNYNFAIIILQWSAYVGIFASILCLAGLIAARPGGKRRGFIYYCTHAAFFAVMERSQTNIGTYLGYYH